MRHDDFEPEISDDDVLIPVAGILDVLDNYAFVRTSGYLPGTNDVYVSLGQVKKYNLRKGDAVVGAIRQPREGDQQAAARSTTRIVKIDSVNGLPIDEAAEPRRVRQAHPALPARSACASRRSRRSSPPGSSTSSRRSARASAA